MSAAAKAGAVYFAIVFAIAFGLGALRVISVAPILGETGAVLVEAPIILSVGWVVSMRVTRHFQLGADLGARLLMGMLAFTFLMSAEYGLSRIMVQRTRAEFFAAYWTVAGAIGLAAQIAFAIIPAIQRPRGR